MNHYRIVLLPETKASDIIAVAKKLHPFAHNYATGIGSVPHVTVHHIICQPDTFKRLWVMLSDAQLSRSFQLCLTHFSYVTFDDRVYWASLMPAERQALTEFHVITAKIMGLPVKENYDPHLTLINTLDASYKAKVDEISSGYHPISDDYSLYACMSDEAGQVTDIMERL